jgi:HK97 gp10 family phage protein
MPDSIKIDGLDEATSRLSEAANTLSQAIADALNAAGDAFVNSASAVAPVDTGFLRDNIAVTESSNTEVVIESQADYSLFVEEGTRNMSAQPFFFQAESAARQEMESAFSNIQL